MARRGIGRLRAGGMMWTPSLLFSGTDQGYAFGASRSAQWQDSGGTTVAAVGQGVGLVADYGPRGYFLSQGVAGSRPILRQDVSGGQYWESDTLDDFLSTTATVNLSGTDKQTVWAVARKASDAAISIITEQSANFNTNAGSSFLVGPSAAASTNFQATARGSATATAGHASTATPYAAPIAAVLIATHDIAGDSTILEVNGVAAATGVADKGLGNFGNFTHYVFSRAGTSLFFGDRIYEVGCINRILTANEKTLLRNYCKSISGISF